MSRGVLIAVAGIWLICQATIGGLVGRIVKSVG